jgi:RNA polymerase sigma-70 factor (ECF subfamily)
MSAGERPSGTKILPAPPTHATGEMRGELDFETLVQEFCAPLYRFAMSLTRQASDADDLVQQTFYLWAIRGHQLADPTKAKAWLFTTLHREFLARQRRVVRFPQLELNEAAEELPQTPPVLPHTPDWQVAKAALARLDPVFQAPIALFYLEDYSYKEIAQILDIPLGTVKSRIARGLAQLQRALGSPNAALPPPDRSQT